MTGMTLDEVERIADVVLFEGYLLFPYSRSTTKNQQRWTFGGVYPRDYNAVSGGNDPWTMQTQCLIKGSAETRLQIKLRFLQVVDRKVAVGGDRKVAVGGDRKVAVGGDRNVAVGGDRQATVEAGTAERRFVDELRVGDQVYRPWDEAMVRHMWVHDGSGTLPSLGKLAAAGPSGVGFAIDVQAGSADEPLPDDQAQIAGTLVREWQQISGSVRVAAELLPDLDPSPDAVQAGPAPGCYRLTVQIFNTTPWTEPTAGGGVGMRPRDSALRHTLVSTHTILQVEHGAFISLLEPPPAYEAAAAACLNVKTWPVLVGNPGEEQTMLSSPIILYDYPRVAPESPGDLFDGTEIDELLTLSILVLTDDEKQAMRESDVRARAILDRTEALIPEQVMKLHGAIRGLQPVREEGQ